MTTVNSTEDFGGILPQLKIVYEDETLIAVVKPAGMSVHRNSDDRTSDHYLLQLLRDQIDEWLFPVHRLDRATSGLLILGKTSDAAAKLSVQFAEQQVTKHYVAVVRGHTPDFHRITHPLVPMRGRGKPDGHPARVAKDALTEFETVERWQLPFSSGPYPTTRCSLLNVFPKTGRWHQIRRHLNYESWPVVGDSAHGDTRVNRAMKNRGVCCRLMLMSTFLGLQHPETEQPLHLECPLDPDFQTTLDQLRNLNTLNRED